MRRNNSGFRPVPRQIPTGKTCLYPRCPERVSPARIFCRPHWHSVPLRLRDTYLAVKDEGGAAVMAAEVAITEWARRRDVAEQMEGAR